MSPLPRPIVLIATAVPNRGAIGSGRALRGHRHRPMRAPADGPGALACRMRPCRPSDTATGMESMRTLSRLNDSLMLGTGE